MVEIRDNIESYCQGALYAQFMNALVPAFMKILDGSPVFISTSPEQVSAHPRRRGHSNHRNSGYETAYSRFSTDYR